MTGTLLRKEGTGGTPKNHHDTDRKVVVVLPLEHFIVAFLPVFAYVLVRDRRFPTPRLLGIVFIGSQFPDLIDKPLAHLLSLIPSGRVFMHSLPFALPLSIVVLAYGWRTDRIRSGVVFVFAYLSHLAADNYTYVTGPNPRLPPDLLWPFVAPIPREAVPYWAGQNSINIYLWSVFSLVVLAALGYLLALDVRAQLRF